MEFDAIKKLELMNKYRIIYEKEDIDVEKINAIIPDDELKMIIALNNKEMYELIMVENFDKEKVEKLFNLNFKLYKLAKIREMSVPGLNIMMLVATSIGYESNKILALLNPALNKKIDLNIESSKLK
jgi:hypothetical protein